MQLDENELKSIGNINVILLLAMIMDDESCNDDCKYNQSNLFSNTIQVSCSVVLNSVPVSIRYHYATCN